MITPSNRGNSYGDLCSLWNALRFFSSSPAILLFYSLTILCSPILGQTLRTAISSGNWNAVGTWDCNCIPANGDDIIIDNNVTVTLDLAAVSIRDFTINNSGIFNSNGNNFTVTRNIVNNGSYQYIAATQLILSGAGSTIDGTGTFIKTVGGGNSFLVATAGDKTILNTANLAFNGGAGTYVIFIDNGITVTNNGIVTNSNNTNNAGNINGGNAASTWTNAANSTLNIAGNLLNNGTLNASAAGNTVTYFDNGNQNIKNPSASTYYNLSLSGSSNKTLQANVIIDGNLTNSATFIVNNLNINIKGNWTNTGTYTVTTGTVTFNGNSDQTVTNPSGESFYKLAVAKAGGTLLLANNVQVIPNGANISHTLTMNSGNINCGSNILTLGNNTTDIGILTYTAGQVIGKFQRFLNATGTGYLFPVGTSGSYNPASVNFTNLTNGSLITEFVSTAPGNNGLSLTDAGVTQYNMFTEGYWDFTAANGLASTNYSLDLTGNGFASFTIDAGTRILKRANSGSPWTGNPTAGTGAPGVNAAPTVKRTGLSGITAQFGFSDDTFCTPPAAPVISGTATVCTGALGVAYSVPNNPGNEYIWTITGGAQASGGTTNAITVDWGLTGGSGNVRCVERSATPPVCPSNPTDFAVTIEPVPTSSITGSTDVGEWAPDEPYSVTDNGYTYTWTVTGGTISSGDGTANLFVNWGVAGNGSVSVVAVKGGCPNPAPAQNLPVNILASIVTAQTGNWTTGNTWVGGVVPCASCNARILNTHTVTLTTLGGGTTIRMLTIDAGGTLNASDLNMRVTGNYIVNGTYDFNGNPTLTLYGANTSIGGTGSITNSNPGLGTGRIIIDGSKIISASANLTVATAVDINTIQSNTTVTNNGIISVAGDIMGNNATTSRWTNAANSTLNIGGVLLATGELEAFAAGNTVNYNGSIAQTTKAPNSTYYNLNVTSTNIVTLGSNTTVTNNFNINSGTAQIAGLNITVNGTTNVTGTLSDNNAAGANNFTNVVVNSGGIITTSVTATYTVSGNVTMYGGSITSTAGTPTWSVGGNFSVPSGTGTIGGGTVALTVNGTTSVTGTLTISSAAGAKTFNNITVNAGGVWNNSGNQAIVVTGNIQHDGATFTSGSGTYTLSGAGTTISGSAAGITITDATVTGTYTLNTIPLIAPTLRINSGGTFTNNSACTVTTTLTTTAGAGTFSQGANSTLEIGGTSTVTTLNASAAGNTVDYNGAGAQTVKCPSASTYHHLIVTNASVKTLSCNIIVNGNLTVNATSALDVSVANYSITLFGNWNNSGSFIYRSGLVTFTGTAAQTFTGATTFYNVTVDKALNNVTLNNDITINNTLTFTSRNIATGTNNVILPLVSSAVSRTSGHVDGNLQWYIPTGAPTRIFYIGKGVVYTPVSITFTGGGVSTDGNLTCSTGNDDHPDILSSDIEPTKSVNRYWSMTNSGIVFATYDATFNFAAADIDGGANFNNFEVQRKSGVFWNNTTVGTKTGTSTQITGETTLTGDYQIGERRVTIAVYTRVYGAGNLWSNPATWIQYRTGLISFNAGSTTVTGSGTLFTSELAMGSVLMLQGTPDIVIGTISSIADDVTLILTANATYTGGPAGYGRQNVPTATDIITNIGNPNLTANFVGVFLDMDATIQGLKILSNNYSNKLDHNTGYTLTGNLIIIEQPSANGQTNSWNVNDGFATIGGNVIIGTEDASASRIAKTTLTTGTISIGGALVFNGTATDANSVVDLSGGAGTVILRGDPAISLTNGVGTLTGGGAGSIVNYLRSATGQTVIFGGAIAYNNLHTNNTHANGALLNSDITTINVTGNLRVQSGLFRNGGYAISGNGTKTFEVSNGATFRMTGTVVFPAGFGTYTFGATSTTQYQQSNAQTVSSQTYGNLEIMPSTDGITHTFAAGTTGAQGYFTAGNGTNTGITIAGFAGGGTTLNVTGDVTISANTTFNPNNGPVTAGGNWTNNGTFTAGTGRVTFNGAGGQVISAPVAAQTFYDFFVTKGGGTLSVGGSIATITVNNLTLDVGNSGTFTAPATLTINSSCVLIDGTVNSGETINMYGDWSNFGGTFNGGTGTVYFLNTGSPQAINGNAASQAFNHITVNKTGAITLNTGGSLATLTVNNLTETTGNFNASALSALNINGTLTLTAGTFTAATNIYIRGDWTNNGGTFTPGTNTVNFDGTGAQEINGTPATQTFYNITVAKTAGTTLSVGGSTTILTANNLTQTSGNFTSPSSILNINSTATATVTLTAGTFTATGSSNIYVTGNWMNNGGTFTPNTSTVRFTGTGAQQIGGTKATETFYHVTVAKSAATLLTINIATVTAQNLTLTTGDLQGPPTAFNINGTTSIAATTTFTAGAGSNITAKGNWTNNGSFVHNSGTVTFNGIISILGAPAAPFHRFYHLTISGGTLTGPPGNLIVDGNFTNNSSYTHNSGTLIFIGSAAQSFTGTTTTLVNNLTITNSSATGVTLGMPVFIVGTGTLTLTDGNLYSDAVNLLTMQSGSVVSPVGGSASSYVDGPMSKAGTAAFIFPTGNKGRWARIAISVPSSNTTFKGQFFRKTYTDVTTVTAPIIDVSKIEYWQLDRTVGVANVTVTLYWENAWDSSKINDCPDLTVARWNGASWVEEAATIGGGSVCTGAGTGNVVTNAAVTSFSPFTFGSKSLAVNPLPIELLSFTAVLNGDVVDLAWTTSSETNNDFFTVEKSDDGKTFENLTYVKGSGTTSLQHEYSTTDDNPFIGLNYYRLKQTDYDGMFTYSAIVAVIYDVAAPAEASFNIYPNPVKAGSVIKMEFTGYEKEKEVLVVLLNTLGQTVYSKVIITGDNGAAVTAIDPYHRLATGVYIVTGSSDNRIYSRRLVVK